MNWTNSHPLSVSPSGMGRSKILALAPLADHTDSPFCRVCRKVNNTPLTPLKRGNFVVFREMVSAEAIVRGSVKTLKMCEFKRAERPIVIQVFGGKPDVVVKAVEMVVKKFKPDGIDINMGCPVSKIARKGESGAALMKDQDRACEIVRNVKKILPKNIPLSVKTRLGWQDPEDILEFAPKLEKAGADLITIHGRTKMQGYSGKADWEMIGRAKKKVNIPVIANGDIISDNFDECLKITGADGLMIGRGALGNPWVFNHLCHSELDSESFKSISVKRKIPDQVRDDPDTTSTEVSDYGASSDVIGNNSVSLKEIIKTVLYHAKLHEKRYGTLVSFRKHLMWYFKGTRVKISELKKLRQELAQVKTRKDLKKILKKLRN